MYVGEPRCAAFVSIMIHMICPKNPSILVQDKNKREPNIGSTPCIQRKEYTYHHRSFF